MLSRKWWKRILIGVAVALALSVTGTLLEWRSTRGDGEKLRDAAVARLDQQDPNWRTVDLMAERNARIPPPERNAGERAVQAHAQLTPSYLEYTRAERWRADLKPGVLPHEEDICEAASMLGDCEVALALARSIRDLPEGGFVIVFKEPDLIGTLLPFTQSMREVASLLDYDAIVHASMNRPNDAVRSAHAILNVGSSAIGDEPFLISQLVRLAVTSISVSATHRTLGLGEPIAGLPELQAAYERELTAPRLVHAFRGERAMMFKLLQNIDDGTLSYNSLVLTGVGATPLPSVADLFAGPLYRKHIPAQQAKMIEMYDAFIAADKLSDPERKAALASVQLPPRGTDTLFLYLLMPAVEKVCDAETRARTELATAVVAIACERHRQRFGRWPESLAAIPKDILPTLPTDPHTGGPLLYAKYDDGVAVYSPGEDLTDDKAVELTSTGKAGTDPGFRLFNPDERRRKPPPKQAGPTDPFDLGGAPTFGPPPDEQ